MKIEEQLDAIQGGVQDSLAFTENLDTRVRHVEQQLNSGRITPVGVLDNRHRGAPVFSFARAICAISTKNWSGAKWEREVIEEGYKQRNVDAPDKRDLSQDTDTAGGFLVPEEHRVPLIDFLYANTVLDKLNIQRLSGLRGAPVVIPRLGTSATAAFVAEGSIIAESDQAFQQVTLNPRELASRTALSNRLLRLSIPAAEQIVRTNLMRAAALELDEQALLGTGAGANPTGVTQFAGVQDFDFGSPDGGAVTYEKLVDVVNLLDTANIEEDSRAWVFNPILRRQIAKIVDGDLRPIFWQNSAFGGQFLPPMRDLLGYPWFTTTQIETNLTKGAGTNLTRLIFGRWQEFILGMWQDMEILATNVGADAFERNQTHVRIVMEVDLVGAHDDAFVASDEVTTA